MNTVVAELVESELERGEIQGVVITDDSLAVDLRDGRTIIAPLIWYPRLVYANQIERQNYALRRNVIYWPDLDEEISVRGMLLGRKSGETLESLQRWLAKRQAVVMAN